MCSEKFKINKTKKKREEEKRTNPYTFALYLFANVVVWGVHTEWALIMHHTIFFCVFSDSPFSSYAKTKFFHVLFVFERIFFFFYFTLCCLCI